jgi:hypothetical protein
MLVFPISPDDLGKAPSGGHAEAERAGGPSPAKPSSHTLCRGNGGEIMAGVIVDRGTFVRGRSIDACGGAARSSSAATAFKARGGQIPNRA